MASIRGRVVDVTGASIARAAVRLLRAENAEPTGTTQTDGNGDFALASVSGGSYILLTSSPGFSQYAKGVQIESAAALDLGSIPLPFGLINGDTVCSSPCEIPAPPPIRVLTVCEALGRRDSLAYQPAVIVGIFKSGMDETLRLDCPSQLISGDVGWPASIGLTHAMQPPDNLAAEVEQKRQEILKAAPPEAPLRPERVIGLYGVFVSLAGLTDSKCCAAPVQTSLPPARLFGIDETDLRVIR